MKLSHLLNELITEFGAEVVIDRLTDVLYMLDQQDDNVTQGKVTHGERLRSLRLAEDRLRARILQLHSSDVVRQLKNDWSTMQDKY
jgi:hypothetical protein